MCCNSTYRLRYWNLLETDDNLKLSVVATVPTVYGIETGNGTEALFKEYLGCNSTYRLRYWNLQNKKNNALV